MLKFRFFAATMSTPIPERTSPWTPPRQGRQTALESLYNVPDRCIKLVKQELCTYLTQHLIDSVTFLLPNMYPPEPRCDALSTGDCTPPPAPLSSLSVGGAKRANSPVSSIRPVAEERA
ncbi:unnamed protein product [Leuciscus chuanchicus]